jgi:lycopene beta-cyclase
MDPVAYRSWSRFSVIGEREHVVDLAPYRYLAFRMADWRASVAESLPRARLVRGAVHAIDDDPYGATIRFDGGSERVRWAFDSRFSPSALTIEPGRVGLWQSFRGARVEAAHDAFDPDEPVLMDFRGGPGLSFGYALPESPRVALIERVEIGARPVPVDLDGWLVRGLGLTRWTVLGDEGGATPMTDHRFPRRVGNRVLAIGIAGGRLKPSTGYGVTRMLRDAERVARSLRTHGHPFDLPDDPIGFRALDAWLLRVLQREPSLAPRIFERLFARNPGRRVLRFLDEDAGPLEALALGMALPKAAFLRAYFR